MSSQALLEAVKEANLPGVKAALAQGARVNYMENQALIIAIGNLDMPITVFLLQNGANPNAQSGLPLYLAIGRSSIPMIKLLINSRADLSLKSYVAAAIEGGYFSIVKMILDAGAPVNQDAINALQKSNQPEIVSYVRAYQANRAAIINAIVSKNTAEVTRLIQQGAFSSPGIVDILTEAYDILLKNPSGNPQDTLAWIKWLSQYVR